MGLERRIWRHSDRGKLTVFWARIWKLSAAPTRRSRTTCARLRPAQPDPFAAKRDAAEAMAAEVQSGARGLPAALPKQAAVTGVPARTQDNGEPPGASLEELRDRRLEFVRIVKCSPFGVRFRSAWWVETGETSDGTAQTHFEAPSRTREAGRDPRVPGTYWKRRRRRARLEKLYANGGAENQWTKLPGRKS